MPPRDRGGGMAEHRIEQVEDCDLIVEGFVNRPAGCGVRRAGEGESLCQHISASGWIAHVQRGISAPWRYVAVAVEKQGSVPVGRNLHQVSRAVAQKSCSRRRAYLGVRCLRDGKNENR